MLARKCDCCGKFYDMYNAERQQNGERLPNAIYLVSMDENDVAHYGADPIDCCPSCMNAILTLIGDKKYKWED